MKHELDGLIYTVALATDANPRNRLDFGSLSSGEVKALLGLLKELKSLREAQREVAERVREHIDDDIIRLGPLTRDRLRALDLELLKEKP